MLKAIGLLLVAATLLPSNARSEQSTLDIHPVIQQTTEWCWVAVGAMVLENVGEPNVNPDYQCGIVGLFFGGACSVNCFTCPVSAGSTANLLAMLKGYPVAVGRLRGVPRRHLRVDSTPGPLSFDDLKDEIDEDRPVIAGINLTGPLVIPGQAQHVVLIIGYDDDHEAITVNDPFPYERFGVFPYQQLGGTREQDGQYTIRYSVFRDRLNWSVSLSGLDDPN